MQAASVQQDSYTFGLIEGFFGIPWSWQARRDFADFMSRQGMNTYIYAPKSDRLLRQDWQSPFPDEHQTLLQSLTVHYQKRGLEFGIGLSPFELYADFSRENRALLEDKLKALNEIAPSSLCILFDDMPGSFPELAGTQAEIMQLVMEKSQAQHFYFCPTYYSFDPVLRQQFGAEPEDYLGSLGELLAAEVQVMWTGPKVVSHQYPASHLQEVGKLLRRRPILWDNYPVNDAERLTPYLHLRPALRDVDTLQQHCSGQLLNPMNQAWLSRLPLYGMARLYQEKSGEPALFKEACLELCGDALGSLILEDAERFQEQGLDQLSTTEKKTLKQKYSEFADDPYAREILDWLDGHYAFDPACLT